MRGRIGGRIGSSLAPSSYSASGMWRLSENYAANRGVFGYGGEFGSGGWPRVTFNIYWPYQYYYGVVDYADATNNGSATFDVRVTSTPSEIDFGYYWQKSTDDGQTWVSVSNSSGSSSTVGYYGEVSVGLEVTGQTSANDGDLYRVVVTRGLKSWVGPTGTLQCDTVTIAFGPNPSSIIRSVGQSAYFFAAGGAIGQTYGRTYGGSYQWQRSTNSGSTWSDFGGSDNTLQFTVASGDNGYRYRLKLTAAGQTGYSNSATLIVE